MGGSLGARADSAKILLLLPVLPILPPLIFDLFPVSEFSLPIGDSRRIRFRFSLDFFFGVLDSASWISELIRPDTSDDVEVLSAENLIETIFLIGKQMGQAKTFVLNSLNLGFSKKLQHKLEL